MLGTFPCSLEVTDILSILLVAYLEVDKMVSLVLFQCLCLKACATIHLFGASTSVVGNLPAIPDGWAYVG